MLNEFLILIVDDFYVLVSIHNIEHVLNAVAIVEKEGTNSQIGIVNFHGEIIPVYSARNLISKTQNRTTIKIHEKFIILKNGNDWGCFVVDDIYKIQSIEDVSNRTDNEIPFEPINFKQQISWLINPRFFKRTSP